MIKISDEDRKILRKYMENSDEKLETMECQAFLDELTLLMLDYFDANDEITDTGRLLERVYDRIYYEN